MKWLHLLFQIILICKFSIKLGQINRVLILHLPKSLYRMEDILYQIILHFFMLTKHRWCNSSKLEIYVTTLWLRVWIFLLKISLDSVGLLKCLYKMIEKMLINYRLCKKERWATNLEDQTLEMNLSLHKIYL